MGRSFMQNDAAMLWRAKQLVTAGYSVTDVAGWIGCPLAVAEAAFADAYPEMAR